MEILNIITPVSRPENLPYILDSIEKQEKEEVKIIWWVVFDASIDLELFNKLNESKEGIQSENLKVIFYYSPHKNAIAGHAHRNVILDILEQKHDENEWVCFIDDDNVLHPNFISEFESNIIFCSVFLVDQIHPNNTLRLKADANNVKVCHVDTGQIVFKIKTLQGLRFIENDYCADGHFIEKLFAQTEDFFIINSPLSYYNFLKPIEVQPTSILDECPVPILQNEWEFEVLLSFYQSLMPENVLEIGSFYGGTLWYWINYSDSLKKIVSIDYPIPPSDERYSKMIESKTKWSEWVKDIAFFNLEGDSTSKEIIERSKVCFPYKDVDFLFIDGGHDYNTVKSDYENYSPLVRQGGIIVLHDVIGLEEVRKYWNELKAGQKYLEICGNNTVGWGIGIIFK